MDGVEENWEAQTLETKPIRINDPGVGQAVVLRHFFFKAEALPKGVEKPDKKQIISHFKKLIEMSLWGDGLVIRQDKPLEVHTIQRAKSISPALYQKMKQEKADFVILCLATAKKGVAVVDPLRKI